MFYQALLRLFIRRDTLNNILIFDFITLRFTNLSKVFILLVLKLSKFSVAIISEY